MSLYCSFVDLFAVFFPTETCKLHLQSKYKNLPTSGSETCFITQ